MVNKCVINGLMFTCYIVKNICPLNKLPFDNTKAIDDIHCSRFTIMYNNYNSNAPLYYLNQ